ncbi:MAG: diaminopimelate epimerase [Polyangiaceae bacterium]|nr:diaminopimelate epimerase [Polyangiaceae bacterium]MCW5790078.1 diaminopimelate epimerase [Polyangiaceae bacterium]
MALPFVKYEGLGNDFIVVEADDLDALSPDDAARLCDRHRGVGGDGVLLVGPPSGAAAATMRVLNADGSRPEMCGNGLRCVALFLATRKLQPEGAEGALSLMLSTDAGPRGCAVTWTESGAAGEVTAEMGRGEVLGELRFADPALEFAHISMGNPHAVSFGPALTSAEVDRIGAALSRAVPGGTNVEFAEIIAPDDIRVVVWERGVGRTQACGTGACATVVAAALAGRSPFGAPVRVTLPGGPLEIVVAEGSLEVSLRGPARRVFSGVAPGLSLRQSVP